MLFAHRQTATKEIEMFSTRIATFTTAIAAGAFGLAAFAGAATASAGSADSEFLKNISAEGITFDSTKTAIQAGQLVCSYLAGGQTGADVGQDIMSDTDLSAHQAAVFVVEATYAYCPKFIPQMSA
jgi:hypothetical protein